MNWKKFNVWCLLTLGVLSTITCAALFKLFYKTTMLFIMLPEDKFTLKLVYLGIISFFCMLYVLNFTGNLAIKSLVKFGKNFKENYCNRN